MSMRTVIVGNRKLSKYLLKKTIADDWNIVGAVTPKGEMASNQANFESVDDIVRGTAISLHQTENINSSRTVNWFREVEPDVCLCGGWSQIIDESVLAIPDRGFLGFHSSKLPKGRGGAPVNWSIINGEDSIWISLFYYTPGVDAGSVVDQRSVPVKQRDDVSTIFNKLTIKAGEMVGQVRGSLEDNSVTSEEQSLKEATYRPRRKPKDGLIDWNREPLNQFNWIRAQTEPYPGAYTFYEGQKVRIWSSKLIDEDQSDFPPGSVVDIVHGKGVDVQTGSGMIRIKRAQIDDQPPMWADNLADHISLTIGDRFSRNQAPDDWIFTGIRGVEDERVFNSNVCLGEHGELKLVAYSPVERELSISVRLNGSDTLEKDVTVSGDWGYLYRYQTDKMGENSLRVRFTGGDYSDTRYHKIFVPS